MLLLIATSKRFVHDIWHPAPQQTPYSRLTPGRNHISGSQPSWIPGHIIPKARAVMLSALRQLNRPKANNHLRRHQTGFEEGLLRPARQLRRGYTCLCNAARHPQQHLQLLWHPFSLDLTRDSPAMSIPPGLQRSFI